jgi:hypothetical protein
MPEAKTLSPAIGKVLKVPASPMFMALLDYALDSPEPRVSPRITALAITSDGFLEEWNTDRPFKEGFVGPASDFERNLRGICAHAGLKAGETKEVVAQAYSRISDWRSGAARKGANPYEGV